MSVWSDKTNATQLTSITTEQFFDTEISLVPGETAHVQVSADFPTTPTDDLVIKVYTTLDDSSEAWDLTTYQTAITLDSGTDPNRQSFVVKDVYKFKVGVARSGSTDTITSADLSYRLNQKG